MQTINLGGYTFECETEAKEILKEYFRKIEEKIIHTKGDFDVLDDLKYRMVEILQEGKANFISLTLAQELIRRLGNASLIVEALETETIASSIFKPRLYRKKYKSILGGVLNGLGTYWNIQPIILRLIFLFFLLQFYGFFLYILAWIFIPAQAIEPETQWTKALKKHHQMHRQQGVLENIRQFLNKIGRFLNAIFSGRIFRMFGSLLGFIIFAVFSLFLLGFLIIFIFLLLTVFGTITGFWDIKYMG